MTNLLAVVADLTDAALIARVTALADSERRTTAELIASLAELDARRLYLGAGCSSLFTYCTQVLHLSEHAAYGRIGAARAARRFPVILERLTDGTMTLATVCLLAPLLTLNNHLDLLNAARRRSKREMEHLVAGVRPQPAVPASLRKLPASRENIVPLRAGQATGVGDRGPDPVGGEAPAPAISPWCAPSRPAVIRPLAPERYRLQFTVSRETYDLLRRAQDLMRHAVPTGEPAAIFGRALTLLVQDLERKKLAAATSGRPTGQLSAGSRHVPAAVKREVWKRDEGRCAFVGTKGRCTERGFLEFHHVVPFATGGETTTGNLQLRCRAHNAYEAELSFGPLLMREVPTYYGLTTRSGPSCSVVTRAPELKLEPTLTSLRRGWDASPRPLRRVTRDNSEAPYEGVLADVRDECADVDRRNAAVEQSAHRRPADPSRRRIVGAPAKGPFSHAAKREQDATLALRDGRADRW